jgi:hypothetical protein
MLVQDARIQAKESATRIEEKVDDVQCHIQVNYFYLGQMAELLIFCLVQDLKMGQQILGMYSDVTLLDH